MYYIDFLPDSPGEIEASKEQLVQATSDLVAEISGYHGERFGYLAENLERGVFWHALANVNGYPDPIIRSLFDRTDRSSIRAKNRAWAGANLRHPTLQRILYVSANQANLQPFPAGAPGLVRGHDILYEQLVENPDSIYASAATPDIVNRLQNGRFWEALPGACLSMGSGHDLAIIGEVLEQFYDVLDPSFEPALRLFRAAQRDIPFQARFRSLGEPAIDLLADFLSRVSLPTDVQEMLGKAYLEAVLAWDDDWDLPLFYGQFCDREETGLYHEKLENDFVRHVLGKFDSLREWTVDHLVAIQERYDALRVDEFISDVSQAAPRAEEFKRRLRFKMADNQT